MKLKYEVFFLNTTLKGLQPKFKSWIEIQLPISIKLSLLCCPIVQDYSFNTYRLLIRWLSCFLFVSASKYWQFIKHSCTVLHKTSEPWWRPHSAAPDLTHRSTSPALFVFCVLQTCHSPSLSKSHQYHMAPLLCSHISVTSLSSHSHYMKRHPVGALRRNLHPPPRTRFHQQTETVNVMTTRFTCETLHVYFNVWLNRDLHLGQGEIILSNDNYVENKSYSKYIESDSLYLCIILLSYYIGMSVLDI